MIWIPQLVEQEQENGPVFTFLTPPAPLVKLSSKLLIVFRIEIWDYLVFGFYGSSIFTELIINIATLVKILLENMLESILFVLANQK